MESVNVNLCPGCAFAWEVRGRRGQIYLLCRNESVPEKYPRQPVVSCAGYKPKRDDDRART